MRYCRCSLEPMFQLQQKKWICLEEIVEGAPRCSESDVSEKLEDRRSRKVELVYFMDFIERALKNICKGNLTCYFDATCVAEDERFTKIMFLHWIYTRSWRKDLHFKVVNCLLKEKLIYSSAFGDILSLDCFEVLGRGWAGWRSVARKLRFNTAFYFKF